MRYIFIGDIHGELNKLKDAIKRENGTTDDTYVFLGDVFDRGPDSKDVLKFIMALPHKILIEGNHDGRLKLLMTDSGSVHKSDVYNGVGATIASFLDLPPVDDNRYNNERFIALGIRRFMSDDWFTETRKLLFEYFDSLVHAAEWVDPTDNTTTVATHGILPHYEPVRKMSMEPKLDLTAYRNATKEDWYWSTWGDTENYISAIAAEGDEKELEKWKFILGHWHTWRLRSAFGVKYFEVKEGVDLSDPDKKLTTDDVILDCSPFILGPFVALDGCSNIPEGIVGSVSIETDVVPNFY